MTGEGLESIDYQFSAIFKGIEVIYRHFHA